MTYALASYKSVEELIEDLPNIHISTKDEAGNKVISPHFHFCFTDPTNRCVVIEPKKGKLIAYENPYNVMTNSPAFPSHVKKLKDLIDVDNIEDFNSAKNFPGGYDPTSRFIKAFYLGRGNVPAKDYREALANTYYILGTVALPNGFIKNKKYNHNTYTRYIAVYDTLNRLMTVKSEINPMVYELSFEDFENCEERREVYLETTFQSIKTK